MYLSLCEQKLSGLAHTCLRFVQNGGRHQRKHSKLTTAGNGEFKRWECCGRIDSDPMGYCPSWNGLREVGLKEIPGAHGARARQTLSPTKVCETTTQSAWEEKDKAHTNLDSRTGPAVIVVSYRKRTMQDRWHYQSLFISTRHLHMRTTLNRIIYQQAQWDCAPKTSLQSKENCSFVLHDCGGEGPNGEMYVALLVNVHSTTANFPTQHVFISNQIFLKF